jgi:predicted DNA-binding transcriptional regulator YafY
MASFDRVYELTAILQSSRYAVSAQELAARLECSLPTVKRYLAKLRNEYNLPVTYSQKYQGYILDKKNDDQVEFPGLWFNVSELHALLAIHELIGGLDPGLLRAELQPLRERIEKLLAGRGVSTGELVKRIQFVGAGIRLCCPLAFRAAATALIERTRLKLNYHSRGENSISTRTISPQRLLYYRGNWYLAAYCHTRGGLRVMALERMSDIVTQNHPATEVDDQTMAAERGVLCGLPALLANGLLQGAQSLLGEVKGYYRSVHILLLLAFMSLCRIKTVEQLRGYSPGEFGKLVGLDRVPEVRCLREKLDQLSLDDSAEKWGAHLSRQWMEADPEAAGTLYIDGHVRVYHGNKTKLPRKYVSRDRLCLRGVCDYWVNDAVGNPFFVVEKTVDLGDAHDFGKPPQPPVAVMFSPARSRSPPRQDHHCF